MMRTKGFAEGLTQGLLDRSCMYGVRGSIPTQPAVSGLGASGRAQLFKQVSRIQLPNRRSLSKSGFVVLTNGLLQLGKFGGV